MNINFIWLRAVTERTSFCIACDELLAQLFPIFYTNETTDDGLRRMRFMSNSSGKQFSA